MCLSEESSPFLRVSRGFCGMLVQVLEPSSGDTPAQRDVLIPDLCRCLVDLFCILDNDAESRKIKDLEIECLSLIPFQLLRAALRDLQKDATFQLESKLDRVILATTRTINNLNSQDLVRASTLEVINLHLSIKYLLDHLSVIWHAEEDVHLSETAITFFPIVIKFLSQHSFLGETSPATCEALLTTLSVVGHNTLSLVEDNFIYEFATRSNFNFSTNPSAVSALAFCFIRYAKTCDHLRLCDAWGYLQDVLLLIIDRRFPETNEGLALLISPTVCLALTHIFESISSRHFILSSPWTMCLCSKLRFLLNDEPSLPYLATLRDRLLTVGKALLEQLNEDNERKSASMVTWNEPEN